MAANALEVGRAAKQHRDMAYDDDAPRDECGVFGIYGNLPNASRVAFFALYALNHRGQESAGIASINELGLHVHKGMGLVSQVFAERDIDTLLGTSAIGHTRYSTAGGSKISGAQPFCLETELGPLALAHNGQVAKQRELRATILARGTGLFSTSDTELIAQLLCRPHDLAEAAAIRAAHEAAAGAASPTVLTAGPPSLWPEWVARFSALIRDCEGAFSLVALTRDGVFGARDALGMRPLCIGRATDEATGSVAYHLASESCALGTIGAQLVREVLPGEIVLLSAAGIQTFQPLRGSGAAGAPLAPLAKRSAFCSFEYVYFSRPDSILEGQMVHTVRTRLGARLAAEAPAPDADIVSGVPDSSVAAAIGFSKATGIPYTEVLCKNRYIARTFIKPDDTLRKNAIQLKYNALSHVIAGKSVVLIDDSLVRGNTLAQLVPLLRAGGATKVHVRISSPPIRHPCYMGVDIGSYDELVAHHHDNVEAIRALIGADSLAYLSLEGMVSSIESGVVFGREHDGIESGHCTACFTGEYPLAYDKAVDIEALGSPPRLARGKRC